LDDGEEQSDAGGVAVEAAEVEGRAALLADDGRWIFAKVAQKYGELLHISLHNRLEDLLVH
jgi:hypothetical protein